METAFSEILLSQISQKKFISFFRTIFSVRKVYFYNFLFITEASHVFEERIHMLMCRETLSREALSIFMQLNEKHVF